MQAKVLRVEFTLPGKAPATIRWLPCPQWNGGTLGCDKTGKSSFLPSTLSSLINITVKQKPNEDNGMLPHIETQRDPVFQTRYLLQ